VTLRFAPARADRRPLRGMALAACLAGLAPLAATGQDMRGLSGAYLAARTAAQAHDYDAASRYYGRALMRDPRNARLLEATVIAHLGLGKLNRAEPVARQLRATGAESQVGNLVLMADLAARGDWGAVLDDLAAGLSVGPLVDGLAQGWAELGRGDRVAAEAAFDRVIEGSGLGAFGFYHKALARAVAGDFDGAEQLFSGEAGAAIGRTRRGVIAHVQILGALGRADDAVALIDARFGDDPPASFADLRARLEAGARVGFDLVAGPTEGMAEVFYTVARALEGEAADDYTLLYARAAEALDPRHVDTVLLSAALLENLGRYQLATLTYNRVPRDDPSFYVAEMGRAEALRLAGEPHRAIEVLEALAEAHPERRMVLVALGDMLRTEERFDAAADAYDRAIALFTQDAAEQWIVYFARGIAHEREDRWPLAEADFRKALELNPGQPSVLNYLGYSWIDMGENLDEALAMIEQAVAARPDSGHIVDSLGWGLYRLGRYEEAVVHMERAAELLPVDPIVNDHLGDVYWAVGRRTEARFQWHRALSFAPEPEDEARIRRKLDVGLDAVLAEEGAPPLQMAGEDR